MARKWVLPLFLLNGLVLLGFRYIPSLDGPLHMARAYLMQLHWSGLEVGSQGLFYDLGRLDFVRPLDLLAIGLMKFFSAEVTHQIQIAILVLLLGYACYALAHSFTNDVSPALLLALPLTFNVLLLFGFFNFVLAIALAFLAFAWWVRNNRPTHKNVWWAIVWCVALWWVHRGGLFIVAVLLAGHELPKWRSGQLGDREKVLFVTLFVLAATTAILFLFKTRIEPTTMRTPLYDLFRSRSLLMVDVGPERWFRMAWGGLFIATLALATRERMRSGNQGTTDGLWISSLLLLISSTLIQSHGANLFYFSERAQVIALLLLVIWAATMIKFHKTAIAIALLALGIHGVRQFFLEKRMALQGVEHTHMMEAAKYLDPGSVLIPIQADHNWLLEHEAAWLMIAHDGAVLSKKNRFWYGRGTAEAEHLRRTIKGNFEDMDWLARHIESDKPPFGLDVMLIGSGDHYPDVDQQVLEQILSRYFTRVFSIEHAKVYRLR